MAELSAKVDDYYVSLSKLVGREIKDILGVVGHPFSNDFATFSTLKVVFADGTELRFEGEHDEAYVLDYGRGEKMLSEEVLAPYCD